MELLINILFLSLLRPSVLKFSFEKWENVPGGPWANEYDKPLPTDVLATSAEAAAMLKLMGVTTMPVYKTDDKKKVSMP